MKTVFSVLVFSIVGAVAYAWPVLYVGNDLPGKLDAERFELVFHLPVVGELLWNYQYGPVEQLADEGNPLAMERLYEIATLAHLPDEQIRAYQKLSESETATARLFVLNRQSEFDAASVDRNYLLLTAQSWRENVIKWSLTRVPNHEKERIIRQRRTYLHQLYAAADGGDADARWVVARL